MRQRRAEEFGGASSGPNYQICGQLHVISILIDVVLAISAAVVPSNNRVMVKTSTENYLFKKISKPYIGYSNVAGKN